MSLLNDLTRGLEQTQISEGKMQSPEQRKQYFLNQGFLGPDLYDPEELERQLWIKNVAAVHCPDTNSKIYKGLRLKEFADLKGYGFRLPDDTIILVSRYHKKMETVTPGWLFKPQ